MSLPKSKCPFCGSRNLGGWSDGEGNSGQFCNDCEWEEDEHEDLEAYYPTHPDHGRQPDDIGVWRNG